MTEVSVEQILAEAGEIVADPQHWHQGYYSNEEGTAFCVMGAVVEAYQRRGVKVDPLSAPAELTALKPIEAAVGEQYPEFIAKNLLAQGESESVYLALWNDDPGRQHSEIVEIFDKARAWAAEKGI